MSRSILIGIKVRGNAACAFGWVETKVGRSLNFSVTGFSSPLLDLLN